MEPVYEIPKKHLDDLEERALKLARLQGVILSLSKIAKNHDKHSTKFVLETIKSLPEDDLYF